MFEISRQWPPVLLQSCQYLLFTAQLQTLVIEHWLAYFKATSRSKALHKCCAWAAALHCSVSKSSASIARRSYLLFFPSIPPSDHPTFHSFLSTHILCLQENNTVAILPNAKKKKRKEKYHVPSCPLEKFAVCENHWRSSTMPALM